MREPEARKELHDRSSRAAPICKTAERERDYRKKTSLAIGIKWRDEGFVDIMPLSVAHIKFD